jgi:hypothetical protein
MILVFLIILIMALIIANILIASIKPRDGAEKGFANPTDYAAEEPEVIVTHLTGLKENNALLNGAITATNRKMDLINERLTTLEKVVMTITQQKLSEKKSD